MLYFLIQLSHFLWRLMSKANIFVLIKTSWKVLKTSSEDETKDVFKTSSRRLHQGEFLVGSIKVQQCAQSVDSLKFNTRVCNLISVPQITRLLLGDVKVSCKTDPCNSSKKEKRGYVKVRSNETILKILSVIRIKQQYSATFSQFKIWEKFL